MRDWQVLEILNEQGSNIKMSYGSETSVEAAPPGDREILERAEAVMRQTFPFLDLPYRQPDLELIGIVLGITQKPVSL